MSPLAGVLLPETHDRRLETDNLLPVVALALRRVRIDRRRQPRVIPRGHARVVVYTTRSVKVAPDYRGVAPDCPAKKNGTVPVFARIFLLSGPARTMTMHLISACVDKNLPRDPTVIQV